MGSPTRALAEQRLVSLNAYLKTLLKHRFCQANEVHLFLTTDKMSPNVGGRQTGGGPSPSPISITTTPTFSKEDSLGSTSGAGSPMSCSGVSPTASTSGSGLNTSGNSSTSEVDAATAQKILDESFFTMGGFKPEVVETRFSGLVEEVFDFGNMSMVRRQLLVLVRRVGTF